MIRVEYLDWARRFIESSHNSPIAAAVLAWTPSISSGRLPGGWVKKKGAASRIFPPPRNAASSIFSRYGSMLGLVTCAPSVTNQSEILTGDSTNGAPTEPMLEICGSPGNFPVTPAISQSLPDLGSPQRVLSIGGLVGKAEEVDLPEPPRPRISRVSTCSPPPWIRRSRLDLSSRTLESPIAARICFISSVQPRTRFVAQMTDCPRDSVLAGLSEILFVSMAG